MNNSALKIDKNQICYASVAVLACLFFSVSILANEVVTPVQNTDWAKEEIMTQIAEMRTEIAELKREVAELKKASPAPIANKGATGPDHVDISDVYPMGSSKAKVAIVEFTDFQCPYCARNYKTVFPDIKKNYIDTGKIQYIAQAFPLSFHSESKGAAIAAHCAGEQKKYWNMHDAIFTQKQFGRDFYEQQAVAFGLKADLFASCLDDSKVATLIESKVKQGEALGVSGTPKFFVGKYANGRLTNITPITGAVPFTVFSSAIDKLL